MHKKLSLACAAGMLWASAWSFSALPEKFEPQRDASADLRHALAVAHAQRKLVFVDVGGEWCAWCHVFDRFVASRAVVRQLLQEHYIVLKVNHSPQNRNEPLLSRWPRPKGFPHFYLLDAAGGLVASQPSAELESGNDYDEAKLLAFLRRHLTAQ